MERSLDALDIATNLAASARMVLEGFEMMFRLESECKEQRHATIT